MAGRWELCLLVSLSVFLTFLAQSEAKIDYRLEIEAIEIDKNPNNILQIKLFRVAKYNRTNFVINLEGTSIKDWPLDAILSVVMFEKMASNKYSKIPVKLKHEVYCDTMANEQMIYPGLLPFTNLPKNCPVKKGPVWIKNYIPDMSLMPERWPGGDYWRFDFSIASPLGGTVYKASYFTHMNRQF